MSINKTWAISSWISFLTSTDVSVLQRGLRELMISTQLPIVENKHGYDGPPVRRLSGKSPSWNPSHEYPAGAGKFSSLSRRYHQCCLNKKNGLHAAFGSPSIGRFAS